MLAYALLYERIFEFDYMTISQFTRNDLTATRDPPPATRDPPPATRDPPSATRDPCRLVIPYI